MEELRPCPFCGKTAELVCRTIPCGDYPDEYENYVRCLSCDAETPHYDPDVIPNAVEYAIASWNTRPIEDELQKNITELDMAVDTLINIVPACPDGFNDKGLPCPYPHDKDGCLKCWRIYLMGKL